MKASFSIDGIKGVIGKHDAVFYITLGGVCNQLDAWDAETRTLALRAWRKRHA